MTNPKHSVGDRVRALVDHMPGMKGMMGKVTEAHAGSPPYYAVLMDGDKEPHKWLTENEVEPADDDTTMENMPASDRRSTRAFEILCRDDATVRDVDFKQRIITVIAVPWEQEAQIFWRGEMWNEVFTRGAFNGLESSVGRVRVNRQHTIGDTVGRAVRAVPDDPQGLVMDIRIARTPRGDETLALADEGMIGPSVGFLVKRPADVELHRQRMLRRVNRAFLDHLSFVESPAYEGAQVLAVREAPSGLSVVETPLPITPHLDEFVNDAVLEWAKRRISPA